MNCEKKVKYLSFGSPLMDVIGDIEDEFADKHDIKFNNISHKALKDIPFYEEFTKDRRVVLIPGGCQFNAMRVFNWMLEKEEDDIIGFVGSVGDDDFGEEYKKLLTKESIIPIFESISHENTGRCLVLCKDRERAHVTDLGASIKISDDFVKDNWASFKDTSLIFTELYILRDKKSICKDLAVLGLEDDKKYGFNLPAPFFISAHFNDIYDFVQCADIVFANIDEATFFADKLKESQIVSSTSSVEEVIKSLAMLPKKNPNKSRIIVITCGPSPAWVCEYHPQKPNEIYCESFPVMDVPECDIIDTNGAGDSFAGGFLSQHIKGKSLKESMKAGMWAASIIIQQRGFQIPLNIHYNKGSAS